MKEEKEQIQETPLWQLSTVEEKTFIYQEDVVFQLVEDYRGAFQLEVFQEKFIDLLLKYDFIVGDWGFDQLRLRGFFYDDVKNTPKEWKISTLEDYLYEYCNFGCPYFVLERLSGEKGRYIPPKKRNHKKQEEKKSNYKNKKKTNPKKRKKRGERNV